MQSAALFWNDVALEANRTSHTVPGRMEQTGPPLSARALAIVHLAMHDAYFSVAPSADHGPYLSGLPAVPPSPRQSPRPTSGMSCMSPRAPAGETASAVKLDSCRITPAASAGFGWVYSAKSTR